LLMLYSNNPYAIDYLPGVGSPRRDRVLEAAAERVAESDIELVAGGSYPIRGEDAGYTAVRLFRLPPGADADAMEVVLEEAFKEVLPSS
jgi:hypothetical protein